MKKVLLFFFALLTGISGVWAEEKTNFVSVVTAIDGSTNLPNGAAGATVSSTLSDGTIMSYGLSAGRMWQQNKPCSTSWTNDDAVAEINTVWSKNLATSSYFPSPAVNHNGQDKKTLTCTANLSNTSSYDADKYVTFYVAFWTTSNSGKALTASGFSSADYSYALAGGTGFTRVNAINDIPCPSNDYTLVKIRGKLGNTKTATVTFYTSGYSGVQWMAVKYNEETYTVTEESENLSDVSNYSSYSSFNVPSGKTLNIDVADYKLDLLNVRGGGTININNAITKTSSVSGEFTGTINVNNSSSAITVQGLLGGCTIKKTSGTLTYTGINLNGTTLDGVILGGSERLGLSNTVTIKNLAGNNLTAGSNDYVIATDNAANLILEGNCNFTHKSNGSETTFCHIGIGNPSGSITVKSGATASCGKIWYGDNTTNAPITVESSATLTSSGAINASTITNNGTISAAGRLYATTITNNGTITALKLDANAVLGEGSTTTLSNATPFNGAVTVSGDATLNLTATTATLNQAIAVAEGKTLTIDGGESSATINLTGSVTGDVNLENATIEGGSTRNFSSLPYAAYDNCTLIVTETTEEFNTDNETINITNIPSGFTTVKLRRADRRYVILNVTNGSATFTDSEAKVSGPKCLYDFTFSLETLAERKAENSSWILNSGSRGSSNGLKYDTNYNSGNSYNEETGLLKVKSTPWRDMTDDNAWPTNYSVAVYANVPDVANGCLMAFGSSVYGGNKYLALIRGASSNEIKLVKGNGMNNAFELIATMSAENATVAKHLVVFTKSGSTFKVYCDGVNVATTTYDQTLGTGFQIGSVHGGVTGTGIIRINDNSVSSEVKDAVEVQSIRIFDGVLNDDQMSALMAEFPYVSNGGSYSRMITTDANLGEDNAWTKSDETTHHIPTSVVESGATYYPDVTITTSADATLTVNEDATFGKTSFGGSGTLTIDTDASGHSINVVGAVIINSDVIVKYGAIDMSTSPVTKGSDATLTFDFSDYDFSDVYDETTYVVTGNTSDYGSKVTGVYPSDEYHSYTLAFNGTTNSYNLTVAPTIALKQQLAIALVQPYYDGNHVGAGLGKYTISLGETPYANLADFGNAVMSWSSLEDYVEPTIAINQPASAFYRIKSGDKYLKDVRKADNATQRLLTNAEGSNVSAETIFYLDNNKFIGYKTGYGFGFSVCQTQDVAHINTQLFTGSAEMGKYTIQSQKGTYSSDTDNVGYWGIDGDDLSSENDAASGACWTIEAVTSLPVTITAAKYATLYSPVALTIPSGVTAYVISQKVGTTALHLEEITGIIPAGKGVILYAEVTENSTYNFPVTTGGSAESLLTGTYATASRPANSFVLGNGSNGIGFYADGPLTVAGFKAYYQGEATDGEVKAFTFDFETAVKAIEAAQNPGKTIYDLNGRRVQNPEKGLYIVNGKKVVIK